MSSRRDMAGIENRWVKFEIKFMVMLCYNNSSSSLFGLYPRSNSLWMVEIQNTTVVFVVFV